MAKSGEEQFRYINSIIREKELKHFSNQEIANMYHFLDVNGYVDNANTLLQVARQRANGAATVDRTISALSIAFNDYGFAKCPDEVYHSLFQRQLGTQTAVAAPRESEEERHRRYQEEVARKDAELKSWEAERKAAQEAESSKAIPAWQRRNILRSSSQQSEAPELRGLSPLQPSPQNTTEDSKVAPVITSQEKDALRLELKTTNKDGEPDKFYEKDGWIGSTNLKNIIEYTSAQNPTFGKGDLKSWLLERKESIQAVLNDLNAWSRNATMTEIETAMNEKLASIKSQVRDVIHTSCDVDHKSTTTPDPTPAVGAGGELAAKLAKRRGGI